MTVLVSPEAHTPIQTRLVAVVPAGRVTSIPAEVWPSGITSLDGGGGGGRGEGSERGSIIRRKGRMLIKDHHDGFLCTLSVLFCLVSIIQDLSRTPGSQGMVSMNGCYFMVSK